MSAPLTKPDEDTDTWADPHTPAVPSSVGPEARGLQLLADILADQIFRYGGIGAQ